MLQIPAWWKYFILLTLAVGLIVALPNALPENVRSRLPSWLPNQAVNLGLDLQGGSYLLLEVDLPTVQRDRAEALMGDVGATLRRAGIAMTGLASDGDSVRVTITDMSRYDEAKRLITELNPQMTTSLVPGARQYEMGEPGQGRITLRQTQAFAEMTRQQILQQSVQVVRNRIDEMGTREPSIAPQLPDRIVVEVPGLQDPAELKAILGKTAKMTFRLVDEQANPNATVAPIGDDILPQMNENKNVKLPPIVVQRRVMVSGDRLTDASPGFDQQTGQPIVNFRFDSVGARQFGDVTKANVGHRFAIVLDSQVVTAPTIISPILGGTGQITGSFTVQSANNMAILLRAGALPAPLKILEERTVGAELGADSVTAGRYSAMAGLGLVAVFMFLRYGMFGIFADIALALNVVLLMAVLTMFGATLTLPGIAGIVLTMGMAVDANVLIYERIREEQRNGRSMLASIDTGFHRAMDTIIDANMTHLIAALILFELGTGPVRGFAVALGVGIITSFFTAVMVTRLIVVTWLDVMRPRRLTI